jgi:predicted adenylyl cyclase CyaB
MEEIEILVKLKEGKIKAIESLRKYKSLGTKKVLDIYYYDPKRQNLKQTSSGGLKECFRLRKNGDKAFVAYKVDYFSKGKWTHSDEEETAVEDFEIFERIVKNLGLKELIRIDNEKQIFETPNFEIVLEDVKNLGLFLEVENKNPSHGKQKGIFKVPTGKRASQQSCGVLNPVVTNRNLKGSVKEIKAKILEFIKGLGLKFEELNLGKPELMLRQNGRRNK